MVGEDAVLELPQHCPLRFELIITAFRRHDMTLGVLLA